MKNDKLSKQNIVLYFFGIIPVVWLGLLIAPCMDNGLVSLIQKFGTVMQNPFHIQLCEDSLKTVLILLLIYGIAIGVYLSTDRNYRRREEHGSAKWGSAGSVNKKYADKKKDENKLLTQNVAIGLDGRKHRRNLNVLVCGGSGAGNQGWEHDISEYLEWLIEKTQEVITLLKKGEYMVWLNENLPYKYRLGSVSMKDYWALYPEEKADHYENISQDECEEFARYMQSEGVLEARIKDMTVNTYLDFCKTGYIANNLKGSTEASAFELYKRYADDRDGGLLTIDPDSAAAFNEWYALSHEEKWKLENPTHMWEAIKGSSRTRVHLSVQRDEKGYYLYVSANEYCCPEYGVRLYNALKRENVPITFYNGGTISKYLNGEGKVGIVPCFDSPSDYFYGGFADKDVGEFINLPDEKYNDLIHKAQWEPLVEVRLKGKDM